MESPGVQGSGASPADLPRASVVLRQALAGSHDALEATPVALAMLQGRVSRIAYGRTLAILEAVHRLVEPALGQDPELWEAFGRPAGRWAAVRRDLDFLDAQPLASGHPLHALVQDLVGRRPELLGAAFLVEGSRTGSALVAPRLAKGLDLPLRRGHGLDLHLAERPGLSWPAILDRLDQLPWTAGELARAGMATAQLMAALVPLFAHLDPGERGP